MASADSFIPGSAGMLKSTKGIKKKSSKTHKLRIYDGKEEEEDDDSGGGGGVF